MNRNNEENVIDEVEQLDEADPNTWVATGEMGELPTKIFKNNSLSQTSRKTILQAEPRNKAVSFEPPVMDRKIWTTMPSKAKDNDRNIRKIIYRFSAVIRPIDNTLRMVYASKPNEEAREQLEAWLLLEQTVLNARALALDALSFANELRQEQALKTTISPTYHKPPAKEED